MGIIWKIGKYLPESVKPFIQKCYLPIARRIYYSSPIDPIGFLKDTYERERLLPPKGLMYVGGGDFEKIGKGTLQQLIEIGGLKPNERVLDVGCGVGRLAIPLTNYLIDNGSYEGFDIVPKAIEWCEKKISPRHPNFHFQLADIYNKAYNPYAKYKASEYKFPFEGESFDFVFLASVFTHMLTKDMENYLSEIARVLRKGGRCFITYFLLNPETRILIEQKQSRFDFSFERDDGCFIQTKNPPEGTVAYDERFIRRIYERNRLNIIEPVYLGTWRRNGKDSEYYQDFILATK
jgi:ubiquinone/menaquinone biosynthesis C-methylase UbiE